MSYVVSLRQWDGAMLTRGRGRRRRRYRCGMPPPIGPPPSAIASPGCPPCCASVPAILDGGFLTVSSTDRIINANADTLVWANRECEYGNKVAIARCRAHTTHDATVSHDHTPKYT